MWFEKLTFGQLVDRAAEQWGDREALCFRGRRWSFTQFREETDRAAKGLIAAGVEPGDHVCLWLANSPEFLFIFFAVARLGAVLVPINTRFRTRDMAYVVTQSDATTLISADQSGPVDYVPMIEELVPGVSQQVAGTLDWASLLVAGESVPDAEVQRRCTATDPDGTAFILYTSGTTGFPKGVMHGHYAIRNVMDEANRMGITANDVILSSLPLVHVFGLYEAAWMAPITGSRQVLMATFDPPEALRLIEAERVTLVHGFDTHFKELIEHPTRPSRDLSSLRTGILAAGMRSTEAIART